MTKIPSTNLSDFVPQPRMLSAEEWEMVQKMRAERARHAAINEGLAEAARLAEQWADEAGGGSGKGGEGYRNLAQSIRQRMRQI